MDAGWAGEGVMGARRVWGFECGHVSTQIARRCWGGGEAGPLEGTEWGLGVMAPECSGAEGDLGGVWDLFKCGSRFDSREGAGAWGWRWVGAGGLGPGGGFGSGDWDLGLECGHVST